MSTADIADNKWEVQASKPPMGVTGLSQLLVFLGFVFLFGWITVMSVVAMVTPKAGSTLEDSYRNMQKADNAPAK